MDSATDAIRGWISRREPHYICVRDVHGVMRAQDDPALMAIHRGAGMVTADGVPLVWLSRARGHSVDRVCGADLVAALAKAGLPDGLRHYFYGGKPGVADQFAQVAMARWPGLIVAGTGCPPFRALSAEEAESELATIAAAKPDVVWVGLSTPKQEFWMRDHVARIPGATLIGVGAAFDFYTGAVKRAPVWMQRSGLEWAHRLMSEPRRLWSRYLVQAPRFVALVAATEMRAHLVRWRSGSPS